MSEIKELNSEELENIDGGYDDDDVEEYKIGDFLEPKYPFKTMRIAYEVEDKHSSIFSGYRHMISFDVKSGRYRDYSVSYADIIPSGLRKIEKPDWIGKL